MHRLLTRETTSFTLVRAPGIGSRYERQPDGSATITAVRFNPPVDVVTETATIPFDAILDEIDRDDEIIGVR